MLGKRVRLRWLGPAGIVLILVVAVVTGRLLSPSVPTFHLDVTPRRLLADGYSTAKLLLQPANSQTRQPSEFTIEVIEGREQARIESVRAARNAVEAVIRGGIVPGPVVVEANSKRFAPTRFRFEAFLDSSDWAGDGMPDSLRLDDPADQQAFRAWFTFLAEAQWYRPQDRLPSEINDCAALIRFAYREAMRGHDRAWANELGLEVMPGVPPVRKYQFPFTPLGANLFRVKPGPFQPKDLHDGSFAQFADARTLQRFNTYFISKDIHRARPGDLLFFRQLEQTLPFHAMIFLGRSQWEPESAEEVIYHTGPSPGSKGEIRRVTVDELLDHPSPRWRPVPGNPNFLGVYRWNILRGVE